MIQPSLAQTEDRVNTHQYIEAVLFHFNSVIERDFTKTTGLRCCMQQLDPAVICQEMAPIPKLNPFINYKALFSILINDVSNAQDTMCKSDRFGRIGRKKLSFQRSQSQL